MRLANMIGVMLVAAVGGASWATGSYIGGGILLACSTMFGVGFLAQAEQEGGSGLAP